MIRHIVMFKLRVNKSIENSDFQTQLLKSNQMVVELESLSSLINEVKYLEVGINISDSPRAYDLILITEFENIDALNTYRNHDEHKKVLAKIKPLFDESVVVDYKK